jgi:hypothetical protein
MARPAVSRICTDSASFTAKTRTPRHLDLLMLACEPDQRPKMASIQDEIAEH